MPVIKRVERWKASIQGMNLFLPGMLIILLALINLLSSCSKDGNCLTNTGPIIKENRNVGDFDSIAMFDYLNLILIQDSVNRVMVEAGENIISGITTEVSNRVLYLHNTNTCNWVRSYKKPINVYVHVKSLRGLWYNSSGDITSTNTIKTPFLLVEVWGGAGTVDLKLNVWEGFFYLRLGTVDMHLHGYCFGSMIYAGGFGLLKADDLLCNYAQAKNYGSNNCYVKATEVLDATIGSIGNIYYYGDPDTLRVHDYGTGEVIRGK